ncbi:Nitroreductase [Ruminococcaceae bacterium FB2012]|nr:Nitroreductase [Ruminococcaceae bacterium FB2012]
MNEVIKAMEERRSIRSFKPDMPPKADIQQIVEAGLYAASARGRQDVITVAVTNKELRDRISDANRKVGGWDEGFDPFYGAPVILIVLADKTQHNYVYDGSLVMGNLMLAAHSVGLGSIWIHRAKEEFEQEEWKRFLAELGIEGEWEGIGHCAVGYPKGEIPPAAPRKEGRVFWAE